MSGANAASGRVIQVVGSLLSHTGGPAYSVPRLAEVVQGAGFDASIFTLFGSGERDGLDVHEHVVSGNALLRAFGWSRPLTKALSEAAAEGAIVHTHGLWLMPNIVPGWIRRKSPHMRLIHSPRGMLAPAARRISAWKKTPVWWLWQKQALACADLLHATADSEYREIRAAGLRSPVAVIPNGVDLPDLATLPIKAGQRPRTILSLGRIHPKKGLDRLLRAWALVEPTRPEWSLLIVGPDEVGHAGELRQLAADLGIQRLEIREPVYGAAKWGILRAAELFVLPTLNENFGISVAESLAAETPVICTNGAPWSGLDREGCGWWIDQGVEPLTAVLLGATALSPEALANMGRRGRLWMERDFGWDAIGAQMAAAYRWLQTGGPAPPWVRLA